ncbi:MAG: FG-GAP repeat protein [Deltaproteobacteria bacterium]|nr:FG-GAP repeat protein [Deltaproteobacteria bacterium]
MEQRLFKKGLVFLLILLVAICNISAKDLVNDVKTTIVAPDDYNALIQPVKTKIDSSKGWIEEQKLLASDGESWDYFAHSVSISGDYALVGADREEDKGSAYVFKYNGSSWVEEQKLIASDSEFGDHFARSVSINDNKVLIGAWSNDENKGSAYVFKYNGTSWIEEQNLIASDGEEDDFFGWSISIDGDNALIGAPKDDDTHIDSGAAYVFNYNGASWNEKQKLTASDSDEIDNFGLSVSINNNKALIGAPFDDDNGIESGSAYVFKYDGVNWNQEQKLIALYGSDYDWFGLSVSIYSEKALIGVPCDNDNGIESGSAYVFKYDGVNWNQEQKLTASDGTPYDNFGWSVSMNNDKILIGAPFYYDYMGAAYLFVFENLTIPDLYCNGRINWNDVTPGETVTDSFTVQNIGAAGTELDWEIESNPDWGTWTFTPDSGTGLTPEDGLFEIEVSIVAPENKNEEFTGEIIIVNSDDPSDTCNIDVTIITPVTHRSAILQFLDRISEISPRTFQLLNKLLDL